MKASRSAPSILVVSAALLWPVLGTGLGCAPGESSQQSGSGGQSNSSGGAVGSGGSGTGGASSGGNGSGGSGSGGNGSGGSSSGGSSSGGNSGTGGRGNGGSIGSGGGLGSTGGSGGDAGSSVGGRSSGSGGAGGRNSGTGGAGSGGSGGGTSAGRASPGCGKSGRPANGKVYVAKESWLLFPASYDGTKPMPALFGFHGCGASNFGDGTRTEYSDQTSNNVLGSGYVVAVPLASSGDCWTYGTDITRVKALYDKLVNNYCVDLDHVFATGHSSGAQFIVQILTGSHTADASYFKFKAVAPVAASDYGAVTTPTPIMYIQGKTDSVRGNDGKTTVDTFVKGNMCGTTSTAYAGVSGCTSGSTQVNPGCVAYSSCAKPTIWCSHNDPAYSGTSHGIPCFAAQAMDFFFKSLN